LLAACAPIRGSGEPPRGEEARAAAGVTTPVPILVPELVAGFPHDAEAFTQGLVYDPLTHLLFEGTGWWEQSELRAVEVATGTRLYHQTLAGLQLQPGAQRGAEPHFGEGIALVGDELVQLTWSSQMAVRWRRDAGARRLVHLGQHPYEGEGWGLCHDGEALYRSDGSHTITRHDADDFSVQGRFTLPPEEIDRLLASLPEYSPLNEDASFAVPPGAVQPNELECAGSTFLANLYGTAWIVEFDRSGRILAVLDIRRLWDAEVAAGGARDIDHVPNGIAQVPADAPFVPPGAAAPGARFFLLTGKRWRSVFLVRVPALEARGAPAR
jgi:glutamine cyclotransferase